MRYRCRVIHTSTVTRSYCNSVKNNNIYLKSNIHKMLSDYLIKNNAYASRASCWVLVLTLTKKRITLFDKKITTQKKSKLAHLR